ncbi:hypothetical protein F5887DRAFT_939941 [Amanita rubescens]|nr:hypothetical protein F5887DRAFT_939941 [Amanita rubescens]
MAIVLHVSPGKWGLPSIDPSCLAAIIFLQLTIPGKFSVLECSNPDTSPSGQLPCLTHDHHVVVLIPSIIKYVSKLGAWKNDEFANTDLDQDLGNSQRSQGVAWSAHAEAHLGDLVYYMLYSQPSNWANMTFPALCSAFHLLQRYYVPTRIREMYRPRLEASGLWNHPEVEKEPKKPFQRISLEKEKAENTSVFQQAFEKEKVVEKAKVILDIYSRLLKGTFFSGRERPISLDAIVSAHVLLLLEPPYPAPVIRQLLVDSYPTLVTHARLIFAQTLGEAAPAIRLVAPLKLTWRDIVPSMLWAGKRHARSEDEARYDRDRRRFFGLVFGCLVGYLLIVSRGVTIEFVRQEDVDVQEEVEAAAEMDSEDRQEDGRD